MLALRSQPQLPEDPTQHLMDYFGNLRSPLWDEMDALTDENATMAEELPSMTEQIKELEAQLVDAQRKSLVCEIFKGADPSCHGMKAMVNKLSGFAKFELDHKLTASHFCQLIMKLSAEAQEEGEAVFSQEKHDRVVTVFRRALREDDCPFKGDLNNELYLEILAAFRAHDPASE